MEKILPTRANRRKHSELLLHRNMQIIFQDSSAALNQRMTVEDYKGTIDSQPHL